MVPVLRTLCFAARALVVGCCIAARPRCVAVVGCVDSCCVALRDVTVRVLDGAVVETVYWGARETRTLDVVGVVEVRVAPNAADVQARITNAKDIRFKMKPLLLFPVFYHKIVVSASVSEKC